MHAWTSPLEILQWIVEQKATSAGDLVTFPENQTWLILKRPDWLA